MCEKGKSKKCGDCGDYCSCDAGIEQDSTKATGRGCENPSMDH